MKKFLSVFLTVSIIASMLCGMFAVSAFASSETQNVYDIGGVKYTKISCKIKNVYGETNVTSPDVQLVTDGDTTTGIVYTKLSSTEFKASDTVNDLSGIDQVDLVRVYYKSLSGLNASYLPGVRVYGTNRSTDKYGEGGKGFSEFSFNGLVPDSEDLKYDDVIIDFNSKNDTNIKISFSGIAMTLCEIEFYKKLDFSVGGANISDGTKNVTNINGGEPLTVTFSDAIDKKTVTPANVKFTSDTGDVVEPTLAYSSDDKVLKFDLKDLKPNTAYTFTMSVAVKSQLGVALGEPYTLSFTTGDIVPFPYYDGRIIKEVSDFSVQNGRNGIYVIDLKEPMSLLGMAVKLKTAGTSEQDANFRVLVSARGSFDGSSSALPGYGKNDGKTIKGDTTDAQYFFLDSVVSRYFALSTDITNNIDCVKLYTSTAYIDSNLTKITTFEKPLGATSMANKDFVLENKLSDGKISDAFVPGENLKSISVYTNGFTNTKISKIRIWYEKSGETDASVNYLNVYSFNSSGNKDLGKKVSFVNTNGAVACAEVDIGTTADQRFVFIANYSGATGINGIKLYELEVYKDLDSSAKFVAAGSSTENVSANELKNAYDDNADSICSVTAKDIILKLEKPTLASAIKVRYNDAGSATLANYSIYTASANDESAYVKIGEFMGGSEGESGLTYTEMIEFPERLVRYVKIERPSSGEIQIADVKLYSKNSLEEAPSGQHWENIMAGLKPSAFTAVDGIKCSIDANSAYCLTNGKFDVAASLDASADANVNTGAGKSGAQYDIDLGDVYTISSINMGWKIEKPSFTGCFTLYGSENGENYAKLTDFNIGVADSDTTFAAFKQGRYRYLRLVKGLDTPNAFTKEGGVACKLYGFGFSTKVTELEVYGLVNDSNDLVIKNNAFEKAGNGYNWSVSVRNYTGEKKLYTAFAACYDSENSLLNCVNIGTITSDDFDYDKIINIYAPESIVPLGTKTIKTFLWNGSGNIEPIMQFNTLEIGTN